MSVSSHPTTSASRRPYRHDVQGLRAIAALLVAVYHIWFHRVSGAVDLFFFISAYFMTGSLLRRLTGAHLPETWEQVRRFWTNLAKRLLPQAWAVLVVTAVAAWMLTPMTWWRQLLGDFVGAATFTVNWVLIAQGSDYLHASDVTSPVQHYWAMAVQGQVYLLWPLLVWGCVALSRRLRQSPARVTAAGLIVVGTASLIWSVLLTASDQPVAYYSTLTRVWEFAAGGLFAIIAPRIRLPRQLRIACGWIGLIGLVSLGMVVNVSALFPGAIAAVPLTFAALIFLGHDTGTRFSAEHLLSRRPLTWLGGISYGIYLWHWPLMNLWLVHNDQQQLTFPQGVVVLEAAIGLAWLTTRFVEQPIRGRRRSAGAPWPRSPWRRALPLAVLGVGLAGVIVGWATNLRLVTASGANTANPGAAVLQPDYDGPQLFGQVTPALTALGRQWPDPIGTCVDVPGVDGGRLCDNDVTDGSLSIYALGDSHTTTWMTALAPLASERGWHLKQAHLDMCPLDTDGDDKLTTGSGAADNCRAMNAYRLGLVDDEHPDIVFTSANLSQPGSADVVYGSAYVETIERLTEQGTRVVLIRDIPRYVTSQNDCAARFDDADLAASQCATSADLVLDSRPFDEQLPPELRDDPLVTAMDLTDEFCPLGVCPQAIGGVVTYIDNNHPTRAYMTTLRAVFAARFDEALTRLPELPAASSADADAAAPAEDASSGTTDPTDDATTYPTDEKTTTAA
jgi:peptidoglycan/LPS O-acetylase OafA/YrhL